MFEIKNVIEDDSFDDILENLENRVKDIDRLLFDEKGFIKKNLKESNVIMIRMHIDKLEEELEILRVKENLGKFKVEKGL